MGLWTYGSCHIYEFLSLKKKKSHIYKFDGEQASCLYEGKIT